MALCRALATENIYRVGSKLYDTIYMHKENTKHFYGE